jgi:predicted phage terminase large subunit-like protein
MAQQPEVVTIGPNPGPQSELYASTADITVYGGQAGGGKTYGVLLRMGVHADQYPGYRGIIFRRVMPMVTMGGGLWDESRGLFQPVFGAVSNAANYTWRFSRGRSSIQFRSLQHESDMVHYQGAQLAEFCFDEATHFEESQFWLLFSRLRTKCGLKARCILTCNPDPDSWVRKLIDWWIGADGLAIDDRAGKKRYFRRDGDELIWGDTAEEVRAKSPHLTSAVSSIRFIPARLADNPRGDESYRGRLEALPLVERERLLGGNWNVRAAAGNVFKREWFEILDRPPPDDPIVKVGRYWDLAATEPNAENRDPDWTRGIKMARTKSGLFLILDLVSTRSRPHAVDALIEATVKQDGMPCAQGFWQDPGSAGKAEAERRRRSLAGHIVRIQLAAHDKVTYARPASSQAEGRNIKLIRGPWNDAYLSEHQAFPTKGVHDDIVDAESLGMHDLTKGISSGGALVGTAKAW